MICNEFDKPKVNDPGERGDNEKRELRNILINTLEFIFG